jgi:hypothetical protein
MFKTRGRVQEKEDVQARSSEIGKENAEGNERRNKLVLGTLCVQMMVKSERKEKLGSRRGGYIQKGIHSEEICRAICQPRGKLH